MIRIILWSMLFGFTGLSVSAQNSTTASGDEFLNRNQKECFATHKLLSCIKYKAGKILWKLATNSLGYFPNESSRTMADERRIRIVHLPEPSDVQLFTDSRSLQEDNELTRLVKFLKRTAELFARSHGIQIGISSDSGTRITSDDTSVFEPRSRHSEKKKRKWLIILPLIILMKIAHLKMTVVPLLLGIIGLNVLLIGGGGWLIHYLKYKTLCKIHPHLVQTHSHIYDSDPSEYSAFVGSSSFPVGHSGAGGGGGYYTTHDTGAYGKDWSTSKAYHAYNGYRA